MTSNPLAASNKESFFCVEFQYGDPTAPQFARYTDWDADVPFASGTFVSTPPLELKLPPNEGLFSDKVAEIMLPDDAFTQQHTKGEATSRIFCNIVEILRSSGPFQAITHFRGLVSHGDRNYQGRQNLVHLEGKSFKAMLRVALGLPALAQCIWTFGGIGCGIDVSALKQTGTVTSIQNKRATITGLPSQTVKYWHRGYIERQGVRVAVKDWSADNPTAFVFYREIPASWLNNTVVVAPGCDKTVKRCREWNNESEFMGFGIGMLTYNPYTETAT